MFEWLTQPLRGSKQEAKELLKKEARASMVEGKAPQSGSADSRRLFGLRLGRSQQKAKELPTRGAVVPVIEGKAPKPGSADSRRLFGLRLGRSRQKTKELLTREAVASVVEGKAPKPGSADSLRSLLQTAIADAEQIAVSIKMRAQTEAEAEAARIIAQAKLESQEIKGRAEIAAQREAENLLSEANRKAEITEVEAKQKLLQFLIRVSGEVEKEIKEEYQRTYSRLSSSLQDLMNEGQDIEIELKGRVAKLLESQGLELKGFETMLLSTTEAVVPPIETSAPAVTELKTDVSSLEKVEAPVRLEAEAVEEKPGEPVRLEAEVVEEKPGEPVRLEAEVVEEKPGEPVRLEAKASEEPETAPLIQDGHTLYTGEVELLIVPPVDLKLVSRLYNYLQTVPDLRILYTRGSWDQGTTIIVVLENPLPLVGIILKTPDVRVIPELDEREGVAGGKSSSLLRGGEQKVKKIKLTLKEASSL